MKYVYHEPDEYGFKDRDGHDGKFFGTNSDKTQHLLINCKDKLTVALTLVRISHFKSASGQPVPL